MLQLPRPSLSWALAFTSSLYIGGLSHFDQFLPPSRLLFFVPSTSTILARVSSHLPQVMIQGFRVLLKDRERLTGLVCRVGEGTGRINIVILICKLHSYK
jgi:hypothetical protein